MGDVQQGAGAGKRVVGLIREYPLPTPEDQKRAIEKYAGERLEARVEAYLTIKWDERSIEYSVIYRSLQRLRPDIVIVYSWNLLGARCRTLIRNLSAIFKAGAKEIHQAYNGDRLTKEEWDQHKRFMARFYFVPSEKTRTLPEAIVKALETMPLSAEEIRALYTALAKDSDISLPISRYQALAEAGALELVTAEINDRELDPTLLPRPRENRNTLANLFQEQYDKRKRKMKKRRP